MRKKVVRIPKIATVRCPNCGKNSRLEVPGDSILGSFECKKCKEKILTPPSSCCIICAFSKKKCSQSLLMEARIKNLEIKYEKPAKRENKTVFLIDDKMSKL
jgi:hypothetical protein